jgi:hypothetical protein
MDVAKDTNRKDFLSRRVNVQFAAFDICPFSGILRNVIAFFRDHFMRLSQDVVRKGDLPGNQRRVGSRTTLISLHTTRQETPQLIDEL